MLFYSLDQKISLQGLLFAGIIIGALGAVMDVAVSIASSLWEIQLEKEDGKNIGISKGQEDFLLQ